MNIIFSAYQGKNESKDIINTAKVARTLKQYRIEFQYVYGVYKGQAETSFLVDSAHEALVNQLCVNLRQESYLKIDFNGACTLVYLADGSTVNIGSWTEVESGKGLDGYSIINNRVYTAA